MANSSIFTSGTIEYYVERVKELEEENKDIKSESEYYQTELAKAHEILGRVIHQFSERWGSVNITKYYPTDNLWRKRTTGNPTGKK